MDTISSSSSLLGKAGSGSEEGGAGAYWVPFWLPERRPLPGVKGCSPSPPDP